MKTALRAAILLVLAAACPALPTPAEASTPQAAALRTMRKDQADRSAEVRWPAGFDPATADLFSHNARLIHAPCGTVFARIVDAGAWPDWYPNARDVRITTGEARLSPGSRFRWTTFGLPLESRVEDFVPDSRIGWFGYTPGEAPSFYHTWVLTPVADGGCETVMEEVGKGPAAAHLRESDEGLMHRGHDLWLDTLRWMAESRSD